MNHISLDYDIIMTLYGMIYLDNDICIGVFVI
jgi:hypothetical protein